MNVRTLESLAHLSKLRAANRPAQEEPLPQVPSKRRQPGQPGLISRVIGVIAAITMTTLIVGSQLGLADYYGVEGGELMAGGAAASSLG